jgi:hypothetical protein
MRPRRSTVALFAATLWSGALAADAQPARPPPREAPSRAPASELDARRRAEIAATVLANPEVRRALGGEAQPILHYGAPVYDKAEIEAYLLGRADRAPSPRVSVVAVGRGGAVAAEVSVQDRRVLAVSPVAAGDLPLFDEDVAEALALVRGNGAARTAVGARFERFQPAEAGREYPASAYVAEALPTRSSDPDDPCSRDRCLEFVFRTPEGYLPLRIQVDLTRKSVTPIAPSEGHHP